MRASVVKEQFVQLIIAGALVHETYESAKAPKDVAAVTLSRAMLKLTSCEPLTLRLLRITQLNAIPDAGRYS